MEAPGHNRTTAAKKTAPAEENLDADADLLVEEDEVEEEEEEGSWDKEPSADDLEQIEEEYTDSVADLVDDPVRMYLREIGRVDLLEPHQEIWLCIVRQCATDVARSRLLLGNDISAEALTDTLVQQYEELRNAWKLALQATKNE